jgi:hypothetical protein
VKKINRMELPTIDNIYLERLAENCFDKEEGVNRRSFIQGYMLGFKAGYEFLSRRVSQ